jgi:hypothetical protein
VLESFSSKGLDLPHINWRELFPPQKRKTRKDLEVYLEDMKVREKDKWS